MLELSSREDLWFSHQSVDRPVTTGNIITKTLSRFVWLMATEVLRRAHLSS